MFDLNDFDETTVGPWEWDVKRLAASLVQRDHARLKAAVRAGEMAAASELRLRRDGHRMPRGRSRGAAPETR